jgi:hypothetical protein
MHPISSPRPGGTGSLPAVGTLVNEPADAALVKEHGRARVVEAIRLQIAAERNGATAQDRHAAVLARLQREVAPRLRRVINASGVILHTNLGRAPLSQAAMEALAVAAGYSNLELDLETGKRGERAALVSGLLTSLLGCESALVVNNNAAAVLLALTALCKGKEVVALPRPASRDRGSFRMPDVMRCPARAWSRWEPPTALGRMTMWDAMTSPGHRHSCACTRLTSASPVSRSRRSLSSSRGSRAHGLLLTTTSRGATEGIADEPTVASP